jgi:hypothetical protein
MWSEQINQFSKRPKGEKKKKKKKNKIFFRLHQGDADFRVGGGLDKEHLPELSSEWALEPIKLPGVTLWCIRIHGSWHELAAWSAVEHVVRDGHGRLKRGRANGMAAGRGTETQLQGTEQVAAKRERREWRRLQKYPLLRGAEAGPGRSTQHQGAAMGNFFAPSLRAETNWHESRLFFRKPQSKPPSESSRGQRHVPTAGGQCAAGPAVGCFTAASRWATPCRPPPPAPCPPSRPPVAGPCISPAATRLSAPEARSVCVTACIRAGNLIQTPPSAQTSPSVLSFAADISSLALGRRLLAPGRPVWA